MHHADNNWTEDFWLHATKSRQRRVNHPSTPYMPILCNNVALYIQMPPVHIQPCNGLSPAWIRQHGLLIFFFFFFFFEPGMSGCNCPGIFPLRHLLAIVATPAECQVFPDAHPFCVHLFSLPFCWLLFLERWSRFETFSMGRIIEEVEQLPLPRPRLRLHSNKLNYSVLSRQSCTNTDKPLSLSFSLLSLP